MFICKRYGILIEFITSWTWVDGTTVCERYRAFYSHSWTRVHDSLRNMSWPRTSKWVQSTQLLCTVSWWHIILRSDIRIKSTVVKKPNQSCIHFNMLIHTIYVHNMCTQFMITGTVKLSKCLTKNTLYFRFHKRGFNWFQEPIIRQGENIFA